MWFDSFAVVRPIFIFDLDDPNVITLKSQCRARRDEKGPEQATAMTLDTIWSSDLLRNREQKRAIRRFFILAH